MEVKKKHGEYSKGYLFKAEDGHSLPKSLFMPLKVATEKKVYQENKVNKWKDQKIRVEGNRVW